MLAALWGNHLNANKELAKDRRQNKATPSTSACIFQVLSGYKMPHSLSITVQKCLADSGVHPGFRAAWHAVLSLANNCFDLVLLESCLSKLSLSGSIEIWFSGMKCEFQVGYYKGEFCSTLSVMRYGR